MILMMTAINIPIDILEVENTQMPARRERPAHTEKITKKM
jgi:hypothetical protein